MGQMQATPAQKKMASLFAGTIVTVGSFMDSVTFVKNYWSDVERSVLVVVKGEMHQVEGRSITCLSAVISGRL